MSAQTKTSGAFAVSDRAAIGDAIVSQMVELDSQVHGMGPDSQLFQHLLSAALLMTGSSHGVIARVAERPGERSDIMVEAYTSRWNLSVFGELVSGTMANGEPSVGDGVRWPPDLVKDEPSPGHVLAVPLRLGNSLIGILVVTGRPRAYGDELVRAIASVTQAIAQALCSQEQQEKHSALEEELRIREERWNYALEGSGEGVFDWDIVNGTIYLSRQWKAMLGYDDTDLENDVATWRARVHPEDVEPTRIALDAYLSGQMKTYEHEYRLRHRDGSWRWILAKGEVVAWTADGSPRRFVGTQTDITPKKTEHWSLIEARDAAVSSAKSKADFLAVMTHELRTPLNAVLGMSTLLADTELDEVQRDYVATLQSGGKALLATVNDILDLSKLDSGKVQLENITYDARALATEALHLMNARALEKGLSLEFRGPSEMVWVKGDPHRIRQILLNLLGNAIKFTHAGGVCVALTKFGDPCHTVRFNVEDTGIGIPADKLASVFEPFSQADASTSRNYGGTGLGLAICKQLVDLMGGHIGVRARAGGGTVFEFSLPAQAASGLSLPPKSLQNVHDRVEARLRERRALVLVADDNLANQKVIRAFLEKLGARVDCVNNGAEAVRAVSQSPYDMVFMDCQMPQMDGYEATRQIRQMAGRTRDIPIVALTASSHAEALDECTASGMNSFLTKPVQRAALREVLSQTLLAAAP